MANGGKREGAGRPKGSKNKLTIKVKEAILQAFNEVGGTAYLVKLAKDDPKAFVTLLGKLIPAEITADLNHMGSIDGSMTLDGTERAARIAKFFADAMKEED